MCGIIGYVGKQAAGPVLLEGLQRLNYRGYDSSGIAVLDHDGALAVLKRSGKLAELEASISDPPAGRIGIGHTRWATHGAVSDGNAHPHVSDDSAVVVVHNGIVENYRELRAQLGQAGVTCTSETDSEVIPQLMGLYLREGADFAEAFQRVLGEIKGGNAVVAMERAQPDQIYAARLGNAGGIVLGVGEGEMFLASDLPALLPHTTLVQPLENGQWAVVSAAGTTIRDLAGEAVPFEPVKVNLDPVAVAKGPYKHFMQKEIMEQPRALSDCIRGRARVNPAGVSLEDVTLTDDQIRSLRRVLIIGMGTSMHAGMVGRFYMERLARLPTDCDNASEFRYREPPLGPETLVVAVTQSGETVDTLGAMAQVRDDWGAPRVAVTNVEGSEAARMADGSAIYLRCGPEIGVASTKTFVASMAAMYLLACRIGQVRGYLQGAKLEHAVEALMTAPGIVDQALAQKDLCRHVGRICRHIGHILYLGRGLQYPVAMEGALKCKEISYIHAEGYPAGEMKHGPIALIDRNMPVIALAPRDPLYDKMWSNIQQVQARDATVIAVGTEGDEELASAVDVFIPIPACDPLIAPFATAIPAQLIAYYLATGRGADVDQPRNLAKTVTVE